MWSMHLMEYLMSKLELCSLLPTLQQTAPTLQVVPNNSLCRPKFKLGFYLSKESQWLLQTKAKQALQQPFKTLHCSRQLFWQNSKYYKYVYVCMAQHTQRANKYLYLCVHCTLWGWDVHVYTQRKTEKPCIIL